MKLVITGAGGGLGKAFLASLGEEHEAHTFVHGQLDVADHEAVQAAVVPVEPDVVFHFAAMTSVDGCETEPARAVATNVAGTFNVAVAARRTGALLVALSTDYVFDGAKGEPYDERDEPRPLASVYAWTKLAGERAAQSVGPDLLIVRTAWVFGAGNDFVSQAVRRLAAGEDVGGIVDQSGTPTHVAELAERLMPLVDAGLRGVVHLVGPEVATWHDVLTRARALRDLPGTVHQQKAGELDRPAPRPANTALTSVVLPGTAVPPMPTLDDSLRRVLTDVGV